VASDKAAMSSASLRASAIQSALPLISGQDRMG
jgi:hypothetical protein